MAGSPGISNNCSNGGGVVHRFGLHLKRSLGAYGIGRQSFLEMLESCWELLPTYSQQEMHGETGSGRHREALGKKPGTVRKNRELTLETVCE
jgi:hypothetical protein